MRFSYLFIGIAVLFVAAMFSGCKSDAKNFQAKAQNPELTHKSIRKLIDILRHDNFAPPNASRIFAYSTIAGYEALRHGYPGHASFQPKLNGLSAVPAPDKSKTYCFELAGNYALLSVGKQLVFSEKEVEVRKEDLLKDYEEMGIPEEVFERSVAYGEAVAKAILAWASKDKFLETRTAPKYFIDHKDSAKWVPTPPQFGDALEPHWPSIRPWVLDSAGQFKAAAPTPFSREKGSAFYQAAQEVRQVQSNLNDAQKETALYWDDNPFQIKQSGHMMMGVKKISPGAHWMNIVTQSCRKANLSNIQSAGLYVKVACAIADGFISCWHTKYQEKVIRPETYINRYIDATYRPLIETPPFPEHTSGHATISAAAATVLTLQLGGDFSFVDSTEVQFGMNPRTFANFYEASDQAALSRLYGGIHYRHGNESGAQHGRLVGKYVFERLTRE